MRRTDTSDYLTMFQEGVRLPVMPITGLTGRIIRGRKPSDFKMLSDDPDSRLVMFMDSEGLEIILGCTGYGKLKLIGYRPEYIEHKLKQGYLFKLAVFPETSIKVDLATWDNASRIICQAYPDVAHKIECWREDFKVIPFRGIEKEAGYNFLEVDKTGRRDERYMTHERFRECSGTICEARAFLYYTVHLQELFSGDGYTYDSSGRRGLSEYIAPNRPIAEIPGCQLVDINVELNSNR